MYIFVCVCICVCMCHRTDQCGDGSDLKQHLSSLGVLLPISPFSTPWGDWDF